MENYTISYSPRGLEGIQTMTVTAINPDEAMDVFYQQFSIADTPDVVSITDQAGRIVDSIRIRRG